MQISKESLISTYSEKESEDLLSLHQSGNLTDTAYSAIECVLTNRDIPIPDRPIQHSKIQAEDSLKQYWRGNKPLKNTFWLLSIGGSLGVIFLAFAAAKLAQMPSLKMAIFTAITNAYFIFIIIALWKNSKTIRLRIVKVLSLLLLTIVLTSPFYFYAFTLLKR